MRLKIFLPLFVLFLFAALFCYAQTNTPASVTPFVDIYYFQGVPYGPCTQGYLAINQLTGDQYDCPANAGPQNASWVKVAMAPGGSINPASLNNIIFVDGVTNTTIQAAITAAGTTKTVIIPSTYGGADTYTNPNNIPILDMRGPRGIAGEAKASDAIQYVSTNGNDSNDGLSMATAKLTCQSADTALGTRVGVIYMTGGGTFTSTCTISANHTLYLGTGTWSSTLSGVGNPTIKLNGNNTALFGSGPLTVIQAASGTNQQQMIAVPETNTDYEIAQLTLDGNYQNNLGPYTGGQALILAGSGSANGQLINLRVHDVWFKNPYLNAIWVAKVSKVDISDNFGINIGGEFLHSDTTAGPSVTYTQNQWIIHHNNADFCARAYFSTATFTNNSTTVTGTGFNTNWGASGFDNVMVVVGQPNYTIASVQSSTSLTLSSAFTGTTGTYYLGVSNSFGIEAAQTQGANITDNTLTGYDGCLEAINMDNPQRAVVSGNVISYPIPHTVGAEGITLFTDNSAGGTLLGNVVNGNTIKGPFSTGIYLGVNFNAGGNSTGNIITNNTVVDPNAGSVVPASSFDNGIRVTGCANCSLASLVGTIVEGNRVVSTRTSLSPARMGLNYGIGVDNSGTNSQAKDTIVGLNWFDVADTTGTWDIWRDNGLTTRGAVFHVISTQSSAYTLKRSDSRINVTGANTITVPHALTGQRWEVGNTNPTSGALLTTLTPDSGTINGATSLTLPPTDSAETTCDGTNCQAGITLGFSVAGTAVMTTAAITAGNCGTTVTVAATGVLTTDTIQWSFNAAPAGSDAGLTSWPTSGNVNFAYCPNSAETPAAATINWRVMR